MDGSRQALHGHQAPRPPPQTLQIPGNNDKSDQLQNTATSPLVEKQADAGKRVDLLIQRISLQRVQAAALI
eukprot:9066125-Pyramimonas_sp.AAC.1